MESVVRNVHEIEAAERQVYEDVLGEQLQDSQQIIVRVLTPPDQSTRRRALADLKRLSREGSQHRQSLGVSDEEVDEILREARDYARKPKSE